MTMAGISSHLGIATQTQAGVDARYSEIRQTNERVRALEQQLGEAMPIDLLAQIIGVLERKLRRWLREIDCLTDAGDD